MDAPAEAKRAWSLLLGRLGRSWLLALSKSPRWTNTRFESCPSWMACAGLARWEILFVQRNKKLELPPPSSLPNETTFCLSVIKCLTHLFFLRLSIDNIEKIFELLLFCSWWFCTGVITSDGIIDSNVWLYKDFLDINCGKGWIRSRIFLKLSSMDLGNFLNCFSLSQVIHSDVPVYFVNAQILLSTDRCLRVLILTDS